MRTDQLPISPKTTFTDVDTHIWEVDAHEGKIRFRIMKINPDRKTAALLAWVRLPVSIGDQVIADVRSAIAEAQRQAGITAETPSQIAITRHRDAPPSRWQERDPEDGAAPMTIIVHYMAAREGKEGLWARYFYEEEGAFEWLAEADLLRDFEYVGPRTVPASVV